MNSHGVAALHASKFLFVREDMHQYAVYAHGDDKYVFN